jgi:hypothetical protein
MTKKNSKGRSWKQHAAPYLRKALKTASRTWKPKSQRTNVKKVQSLRSQREKINEAIRKELAK